MEEILILDACSIINLMRIDTDEEFLGNWIRKTNPYIAETVIKEVNANYKKNSFEDEHNREQVEIRIKYLNQFMVNDKDVESYDGNVMMDELKKFSKHKKKANGELYSTALCLKTSQEYKKSTLFVTDDYPAKDEFAEYFTFHQIGYIVDTIDLLLLIYHHNEENVFSKNQLIEFISKLKYRYGEDIEEIIKMTQALQNMASRRNNKKDKLLALKLENIIECIDKQPEEGLKELAEYLNNIETRDAKKIIHKLENIKQRPPQIFQKLKHIEFALKNYKIYKL